MDHGGHMGHDMPMPMPEEKMCKMNMLWNHDVEDVCVVFPSWHISGPLTMALSCLAIVVIATLYSYLLHYISQYNLHLAYSLQSNANPASRRESVAVGLGRRESLIPPMPNGYSAIEQPGNRLGITRLSYQTRLVRALLYALSVTISFWLMLVAMTYNTYLFASIILGAFVGHLLYEGDIDVSGVLNAPGNKGLACH